MNMSMNMQNGSAHRPASASGSLVARSVVIAYGALAYMTFVGAFSYAIGFVSQFVVPKTIDSGAASAPLRACIVDLALMSLFAIQHSGMARRGFKRLFASFALPAVERSTYVLLASLTLMLLFSRWQPIMIVVWQIETPVLAYAAIAGGFVGWLIVLYSTFLISHFELFGLTQVITHFTGRLADPIKFKTPGLYRLIRHPIYLGFIIAFWATPTMTLGHMLFAAVTTAYILVGIWLEERDLVALFGEEYRRYREKVAMLLPGLF